MLPKIINIDSVIVIRHTCKEKDDIAGGLLMFPRWVSSPLKSFRPTTGTLMLMTALHAGCDQVSVYGMGYNDKYTLYYYDSAYRRFRMDKLAHDTLSELAVLKGLDQAGIIAWYKRDVAEFYHTPQKGPQTL